MLRTGGVLLSGFPNPAIYLFDDDLARRTGVLQVKHVLPYSEGDDLSAEERERWIEDGWPLEFSHTLGDQIGGQLAAGFVLTALYEDRSRDEVDEPLVRYMSTYVATRAVKPLR